MLKYTLTAVLVLAGATAAIANPKFMIIQDENNNCRVIEHGGATDQDFAMAIGKETYQTREAAELDLKVVCN